MHAPALRGLMRLKPAAAAVATPARKLGCLAGAVHVALCSGAATGCWDGAGWSVCMLTCAVDPARPLLGAAACASAAAPEFCCSLRAWHP